MNPPQRPWHCFRSRQPQFTRRAKKRRIDDDFLLVEDLPVPNITLTASAASGAASHQTPPPPGPPSSVDNNVQLLSALQLQNVIDVDNLAEYPAAEVNTAAEEEDLEVVDVEVVAPRSLSRLVRRQALMSKKQDLFGTYSDEEWEDDDFEVTDISEPSGVEVRDHEGTTVPDGSHTRAGFDIPGELKVCFEKKPQQSTLSPFVIAMGIVATLHPITNQLYSALHAALQLVQDVEELKSLPLSLSTLQEWINRRLPMPTIFTKSVNIDRSKVGNKDAKGGVGDIYIIDERDLIKQTLEDSSIRSKLHLGFAELVYSKSELWHGDAWQESIRASATGAASSCRWPSYANDPDQPILQSDFAEVQDPKRPNPNKSTAIRVRGIARDCREDSPTKGELVAIAEMIKTRVQLPRNVQQHISLNAVRTSHYVLVEAPRYTIPISHIHRRLLNVHFKGEEEAKKRWVKPQDEEGISSTPPPEAPGAPEQSQSHDQPGTWIDYIVNEEDPKKSRSIQLRHPIRAELELREYGRDFLIARFIKNPLPVFVLPLSCFSDGFGAYRNSYRSLLAVYITICNLPKRERRKLRNTKLVTLGPFGAPFPEVVQSMAPIHLQLEEGIEMELQLPNVNVDVKDSTPRTTPSVKCLVCAPYLLHISDLPQQNDSSGTLRQNAVYGCRYCLIGKDFKDNLNFDIVLNGRYEYLMDELRRKISKIKVKHRRKAEYSKYGLSEERCVWNSISPALPQFISYPMDICHSELSGMVTRVLELTSNWLLTEKRGREAFIIAFRRATLPVGWARFQNPVTHMKSYSFADKGRLSLLLPFFFRDFFQEAYVKAEALEKIREEFKVELDHDRLTPVLLYQRLLLLLAQSNALLFQHSLSDDEQHAMCQRIIEFRSFFQRFAKLTGTAKDEDAGKKAIRRPNIHQALHARQNLGDYGTFQNFEVSIGETKHKQLKDKAQRTNKVKLDKQLILDAARREAVQGILREAQEGRGGQIAHDILHLTEVAPRLFDRILPWSLETDEIDETDQDQGVVGGGENFANIRVSQQLTQKAISKLLIPSSTDVDETFHTTLDEAYGRDYNMRLLNFGAKRIKYRKKVYLITRENETRMTLQEGRFVKTTSGVVGRICAMFTHERLDELRIFVALRAGCYVHRDRVVDANVYTFPPGLTVVGLPAILPGFLHMIPVMEPKLMRFKDVQDGELPFKTKVEGPDMQWWHNDRLANFL